jgi:hypothetical protein
MVMNTPDGPVSFVFHKDAPLPQRIDGYFNEVPVKKKSSAGTEANTTDDDAIDSDSSETSVIDSVSESQAESVEGSDSAEESNPATNE